MTTLQTSKLAIGHSGEVLDFMTRDPALADDFDELGDQLQAMDGQLSNQARKVAYHVRQATIAHATLRALIDAHPQRNDPGPE